MKHRKLENSYISALCVELSMMLEAGIPPADCLLMLLDDEPTKDGKMLMRSVLDPLERGFTLSNALRQAGHFPRYMTSMVEIGEKTGRVTATLKALASYYDRQDRLSVSIKNAVLYPAILLVMMLAVVLILVVRVLPIFNETFTRLGAQMNPIAASFMRFGAWFETIAAGLSAVLIVLGLIALVVWASPALRSRVAKGFKRAFGHRGIMGAVASMRFVSAMALTIASGLDMQDALKMAISVSGGAKHVDEQHKKCIDFLVGGATLAEAMLKSDIISARDSRMLSLGTRSGKADLAMAEIATRRERTVQDDIDRAVGKLEPVLVAASSLFVGAILLSVMFPLMGIMSAIE